MGAYLLRRLLLVVPTLFGIIAINFFIVQLAPGGPVDQMIANLRGNGGTASVLGGGGPETMKASGTGYYRGSRGLDPETVDQIKEMFGFDQPAPVRFEHMLVNYLHFNLGNSFFRGDSVIHLIERKMPISISLGLWSTLLIYLISIPLGIEKAVREGSRFDVMTSVAVLVGYAIPGFLFAILLIVLFAGGSFWQWFPLRGLSSENAASLPFFARMADYVWHMVLPTTAIVVGGFASLTILTKNCFLEEIRKQYIITARAKGCSETQVLYGHIFRNAMLLVVSGFPAAFIGILFTSSLLIEVAFSLDGLGLLGYQAAIQRDYPVVFGTLYIYTLVGLLTQILGDFTYTLIDPRIDFEKRG